MYDFFDVVDLNTPLGDKQPIRMFSLNDFWWQGDNLSKVDSVKAVSL